MSQQFHFHKSFSFYLRTELRHSMIFFYMRDFRAIFGRGSILIGVNGISSLFTCSVAIFLQNTDF